MAGAEKCRGCGGVHFANERVCPRTKRPVEDGPFGSLVGPYRVGKLLGAGGFGAVHVAEDTRVGASVALKLLHPELVADRDMLDRFMREADVTVRAGNPHIVRVLDASFTGRSVYVALELLTGDTLANAMRGGPMAAEHAVDIAIQTLDGLAVAHAAGVIHRDIKPGNIFLADDGDALRSLVKILDFGIGRMLTANQDQRLTRTGAQLGTPHFMAPEQVTDAKRADARADLYAVAVTLYAMLTAERPYGNIPIGDWIGLVARRAAPSRASSPFGPLPEALVEAIAIGLSVDPARRFQDAGAFARALLDSMPNSPAMTRALPALRATSTFAAPPSALEVPRAPAVANDARRGTPAPRESVSASTRRSTLLLVGTAASALLLTAGLALAVGLLVHARYRGGPSVAAAEPPPSATVTLTPAAGGAGGSASAHGAPSVAGASPVDPFVAAPVPLPPGLGVHFGEPTLSGSNDEIDLAMVNAVLRNNLQRFERCRVLGRATHANVLVDVEAGGALRGQTPVPSSRDVDIEVSRCIASRFSEASVGVRYGTGRGGAFYLTADLDGT